MIMQGINIDIIKYIRSRDYDEDVKKCLIESILIEYDKFACDFHHYTNDYDKILNKYIKVEE